MELIPPVKNKSVFVIYIVSQDDGVVTASSDFIGDDVTVRRVGMEALNYLFATSQSEESNLYVSNMVNSLKVQ